MFDNMLCFLSVLELLGGLYLFLTGFAGFGCLDFGILTVRLLLRLARRDSSNLSKSNFQNPPLPGSSFDLATFTKHLFRLRLCRIEFCNRRYKRIQNEVNLIFYVYYLCIKAEKGKIGPRMHSS